MVPDDLSPKAARLFSNLKEDWLRHQPPALPKNVNAGIGGVSLTNEAAVELEDRGLIRIEENPISAKWEYYPTEKFPKPDSQNTN